MLPPPPALPGLPALPGPALTRPAATPEGVRDARLRDAAQRLEAGFLKEMLAAAGLGRTPGLAGGLGGSGGGGESPFASFLLEAQATEMARAGGIGLAQSLFEALARDAR